MSQYNTFYCLCFLIYFCFNIREQQPQEDDQSYHFLDELNKVFSS